MEVVHERPEDENVYVVEKITGKKTVRGKIFYGVKWQDFPQEECTWEPLKNLQNVKSLIQEFENQKKELDGETDTNTEREKLANITETNSFAIDDMKYNTSMIVNTSANVGKDNSFNQKSFLGESLMNQFEEKKMSSEKSRLQNNTKQSKRKAMREKRLEKKAQIQKKAQTRAEKKVEKESKRIIEKKVQQSKIGESKRFNNINLSKKEDITPSLTIKDQMSRNISNTTLQEFVSSEKIVTKIRALERGGKMNQYLVEYANKQLKIFNSFELVIEHPVEILDYLEKKSHPSINIGNGTGL